MFGMTRYIVVCGWVLCAVSVGAHSVRRERDALHWDEGRQWNFAVKQYYRDWAADFSDPRKDALKNVPRVQSEYHMTVRVGGVRTIDQEKCVDFVFTPGERCAGGSRRARIYADNRSGHLESQGDNRGEEESA